MKSILLMVTYVIKQRTVDCVNKSELIQTKNLITLGKYIVLMMRSLI